MGSSVKKFINRYKLYIRSVVGIFLCLFLYGQSINITNTKIYDQYNNLRSSDFNDFYSKTKDLYVYKFDLNLLFSSNRKLIIYPNDCIKKVEINGGEYYFDEKEDLCDSDNGVMLDLSKYTHIGKNFVNIYTQQWGHNRAITIGTSGDDNMQFLFFTAIILLFRTTIGSIIRSSSLPRSYKFIFIVLFGIILGLSYTYFIESSFTKRTNDVIGHIDYIKIVSRGDLIPPANRCRVCYHPPLYYRFSAIIYKISIYLHILNPYDIIRLVGILLYSVTLFFGIKFLYLAFENKPIAFWLSALLLLFWPLNFYFGPRIINDNFFYFFSFIFIYLILFWYKSGSSIFEHNKGIAIWTFIILLMGLFSKSNFIIWLPLLFVTLYKTFSIWDKDGNRLFKRSLINNIKRGFKYYAIAIGIPLFYFAFQSIFKSPELVANVTIFGLVGNISHVDMFQTFTSFDYHNFVNNLKWWHDTSTDESNYFWNYLFKSMLYSENSIYNKFKTFIGLRMNFIFFLFLISILIKFLFSDKRKVFYVVGFGAPIIAMIIYRIKYPYISTMHYRYIFPHILFFLYYLCSDFDIGGFKNIKIVNYISLILVTIFIILSVLFSLPPYY